jgi:hypothetical protein
MPSDCVGHYAFLNKSHQERISDPTARYLNFIQEGLTYKKWYCGHFHDNNIYRNDPDGGKEVQVLYDYIVDPDDGFTPVKNYGRNHLYPLWM